MSGEIQRFDKPRDKVKIVGAADTQSQPPPQIMDRTTRQAPVSPEIVVHSEEATEGIRVTPRRPDEPQVRMRSSDQEAWEKAKRDA